MHNFSCILNFGIYNSLHSKWIDFYSYIYTYFKLLFFSPTNFLADQFFTCFKEKQLNGQSVTFAGLGSFANGRGLTPTWHSGCVVVLCDARRLRKPILNSPHQEPYSSYIMGPLTQFLGLDIPFYFSALVVFSCMIVSSFFFARFPFYCTRTPIKHTN